MCIRDRYQRRVHGDFQYVMSLWYLPLIISGALFFGLIGEYYFLTGESVVQTVDRYSAANFHEILSTHYHLDLTIDFDKSILSGSIVHSFKSVRSGVKIAVLDARDLAIKNIFETKTKKQLSWKVYSFDYIENMKNDQLVIFFSNPLNNDEQIDITIEYATIPTATAVSWVPENQTFGKDMKFMYTQCEAIHCRSIAPLQDGPGVKSTFNATLRVAAPYVAIASALLVSESQYTIDDGAKTMKLYEYAQHIPVPSYLLALVAGHIEFKMAGKRAGVYAEPKILNQSVWELGEMDAFMSIIENILTPYAWGTYNVIVMPPSFPYGGMENPYLTFVSPSVIVGDRSSSFVVAHEIGHSWFGNQLTARNWSHFWLNEGFTRYVERLVIRKLYGETKYICQCRIGMYGLKDIINGFIHDKQEEFTKLFPNAYRAGPDDIMSTVAYDKGFLFLVYLEGLIGTNNFYDFLRAYLTTFSYRSLEVWDMKNIFESYVSANLKNSTEVLKKINWNKWLFGVGMPDDVNTEYNNEFIQSALDLANYYINHKEGPANKAIYKTYIVDLRLIFMRQLIDREKDLTPLAMKAIDKDFNITYNEANPEVASTWFRLMVKKSCKEADPRAKEFLSNIGRQKLVVPIYASYVQVDKSYGWKLYQELKYKYHPIAQRRIEKLFN
eukprot:TRINITY_DN5024_c0_g1_i1.p1 TRINITY_DN5024_c0_g1~~TRINITY_DN5024_c0_g1_i1.p1  ORF type:complete len:687 (+),score=105.74 TRINITY_DN5024_c0_g1_i1:62-2062(+)